MDEYVVDPEIRAWIPEPPEIRPTDERKGQAGVEPGCLPASRWRANIRHLIEATDHAPPITVWKETNIILDGVETYLACRELGRTCSPTFVSLPSRKEAIAWRIRQNLANHRHLSEFLRCEQVVQAFNAGVFADLQAAAAANKGGRGKKAKVTINVNQELAGIAGVSPTIFKSAKRIMSYVEANNRKPFDERKISREDLEEKVRLLRNGINRIDSECGNLVALEARATRRAANHQARTQSHPEKMHDDIATAYIPGRTNYVIQGDCLPILRQMPEGAVGKFVFSPPYYGEEGTSFVDYGGDFKGWPSWEHYQLWMTRLLVEMWRILPVGGGIAINVDNIKERKVPKRQNRKGERVGVKELTGRVFYHTTLIRKIMDHIDVYSPLVAGNEEEYENPTPEQLETLAPLSPHHAPLSPNIVDDPTDAGDARVVPARDFGEVCWDKQNVVGKTEATGSFAAPNRRMNHECVLFFFKGKRKQSEMIPLSTEEDRQLYTLDTWHPEKLPQDWSARDKVTWASMWQIAPSPDPKKEHAAKYPPQLAYGMIVLGSDIDDVICDPFSGTGTTLYVAATLGCKYIGIDINPRSCERSRQVGKLGEKQFVDTDEKPRAALAKIKAMQDAPKFDE